MASEKAPVSIDVFLSEDFDDLYDSVRFSDCVVDWLSRERTDTYIIGHKGKAIALTGDAWEPDSRDLRDSGKSLQVAASIERTETTDLYRRQWYQVSGEIQANAVAAIALVSAIIVNAKPSFDSCCSIPDLNITNGIVEVLHRAYAIAETFTLCSVVPEKLCFPLEALNLFGGETFAQIFVRRVPVLEISGCENLEDVRYVPWEVLAVVAFHAGFSDIRLVKAMVYTEMVLRMGKDVTASLAENNEAFDVLVAQADEILALASPEMVELEFQVLRLCGVLEGTVVDDEMKIVEFLCSCDLGSKSLRPGMNIPSSETESHAIKIGSNTPENEGSQAVPGSSRKGLHESCSEKSQDTIIVGDYVHESGIRNPDNGQKRRTVSFEEAQTAFADFKRTGDLLCGAKASVYSLTDDVACLLRAREEELVAEGISFTQMLQNMSMSVDDDLTSILTERVELGKLWLIPPSKMSWLGEKVPMSISATVNEERWDIRLRNGKLIVKTVKRAKASLLKRRLQQLTGIQVLGNGINMKWEEKEEYDAGLVSEVLRGAFGIGASRWLLNHIWRGNILASGESPTNCYCPTSSGNEGYNVCALIPFDVISDTRFYYDRENGKAYWMPRKGDKLREVYVSSGGSIRFKESDFESEKLEKCSIVTDKRRRVG